MTEALAARAAASSVAVTVAPPTVVGRGQGGGVGAVAVVGHGARVSRRPAQAERDGVARAGQVVAGGVLQPDGDRARAAPSATIEVGEAVMVLVRVEAVPATIV